MVQMCVCVLPGACATTQAHELWHPAQTLTHLSRLRRMRAASICSLDSSSICTVRTFFMTSACSTRAHTACQQQHVKHVASTARSLTVEEWVAAGHVALLADESPVLQAIQRPDVRSQSARTAVEGDVAIRVGPTSWGKTSAPRIAPKQALQQSSCQRQSDESHWALDEPGGGHQWILSGRSWLNMYLEVGLAPLRRCCCYSQHSAFVRPHAAQPGSIGATDDAGLLVCWAHARGLRYALHAAILYLNITIQGQSII